MPLRRIIVAPPPSPTSMIINKPTFIINRDVTKNNDIVDFIGVTADVGDTAVSKNNKIFVYTSTGGKELLFDLEL